MKNYLLTAAGLMAGLLSYGQSFQLLPSNDGTVFQHHLTPSNDTYSLINGQQYVDYTKSHKITSMEIGAPALPTFAESVIVPNQGQVSLEITHDGYQEYTNVLVAPSKGSLKRNVDPSQVPYTFGASYSTDAFFPANIAALSTPFQLRQTRGVTVRFSPYQYNPVTKTLRVYNNIQVRVITDENTEGENELHSNYRQHDPFMSVYSDFYLNTNEVFGRYTPVEEEGELLIITADGFADEIQPFVDWKIQEGIKTTVVGTSTAGSTDTQIKSYISNFYASNPDLVYVLLVGDHADVPSHTYGSSGWEQLWSDSYYGQLSGGANDYYPELFVGRFSGNASEITTMVERTLEYEKTPAAGDWMAKAIGLASNEGDGYGDEGEADWLHARNNRAKLLNYGYVEVFEFYDGSQGGDDAPGNPTPAIISPAVNDGIGLFNYTGHGDETTCITGNYSSSDINSATNNGMYPFVISVACNNGTFTSGTCISEDWQRATNAGSPTGAIAACGSTILMAWAEPMQTQDEMTDIIAHTYQNNRKKTLGGIFYNSQMSMLEEYSSSNTAVEVMQTWVMFGDPSTMFRNQATQNMTVTHVGNVPMSTSSVTINVDTDDATVAIVQDGEILGKGISSGGSAVINFAALTSNQPLIVTVTKQNFKPYQGIITVADGPAGIDEVKLSSVRVYPNPATNVINIDLGTIENSSIVLQDMSGKIVFSTDNANGTVMVPTVDFAAGMYVLQLDTSNGPKSIKVSIQ